MFENNKEIKMQNIGVIHSPFKTKEGTPIQPRFADNAKGVVELNEKFAEALLDLDGFERIWLIYAFDRSKGWKSKVVPFRDTKERGVFATRAPKRPNPIGMSSVRLIKIEGLKLYIEGLDILDKTPLLDIKPYVPLFDDYPESKAGWLDAKQTNTNKADTRFDD